MMNWVLANGDILPETFEFLHLGWWIVHVVAIVVVFTLGCTYGQKYAKKRAQQLAGTKPDTPQVGGGN